MAEVKNRKYVGMIEQPKYVERMLDAAADRLARREHSYPSVKQIDACRARLVSRLRTLPAEYYMTLCDLAEGKDVSSHFQMEAPPSFDQPGAHERVFLELLDPKSVMRTDAILLVRDEAEGYLKKRGLQDLDPSLEATQIDPPQMPWIEKDLMGEYDRRVAKMLSVWAQEEKARMNEQRKALPNLSRKARAAARTELSVREKENKRLASLRKNVLKQDRKTALLRAKQEHNMVLTPQEEASLDRRNASRQKAQAALESEAVRVMTALLSEIHAYAGAGAQSSKMQRMCTRVAALSEIVVTAPETGYREMMLALEGKAVDALREKQGLPPMAQVREARVREAEGNTEAELATVTQKSIQSLKEDAATHAPDETKYTRPCIGKGYKEKDFDALLQRGAEVLAAQEKRPLVPVSRGQIRTCRALLKLRLEAMPPEYLQVLTELAQGKDTWKSHLVRGEGEPLPEGEGERTALFLQMLDEKQEFFTSHPLRDPDAARAYAKEHISPRASVAPASPSRQAMKRFHAERLTQKKDAAAWVRSDRRETMTAQYARRMKDLYGRINSTDITTKERKALEADRRTEVKEDRSFRKMTEKRDRLDQKLFQLEEKLRLGQELTAREQGQYSRWNQARAEAQSKLSLAVEKAVLRMQTTQVGREDVILEELRGTRAEMLEALRQSPWNFYREASEKKISSLREAEKTKPELGKQNAAEPVKDETLTANVKEAEQRAEAEKEAGSGTYRRPANFRGLSTGGEATKRPPRETITKQSEKQKEKAAEKAKSAERTEREKNEVA